MKILLCVMLFLLIPFQARAETTTPDSLRGQETEPMGFELTPEEEQQLWEEFMKDVQQHTVPETMDSHELENDSQGLPIFYTSSAEISMEQGSYCYTLPGGTRLLMSVPDGGVSFRPVILDFPDGSLGIYALEIDGVPDYNLMDRRFEDEGEYELTLYFLTDQAGERIAGYKIPIHFRIGRKLDRETEFITAPEGFRIQTAARSGKPLKISGNSLDLSEDGVYEITFVAVKNPKVKQEISFTMDREAPTLIFSSSIDTGEKVKPPLTITKTEPDSQVRIIRDTLEYAQFQDTLTEGGRYRILVSDPAGNTQEYRFVLAKDHTRAIRNGIIIIVIVLLGIVGYMAFLRRHMRIL